LKLVLKFLITNAILLIAFCMPGNAQTSYSIEGKIVLVTEGKIYLSSVFGERPRVIDSAVSDREGNFTFSLKPAMLQGLYRISWGKDKFFDLLWNRENIRLSTRSEFPADSIKFQSSVENQVYYFYLKLERLTQQKLDVLMPVIDYYPVKDGFYGIVAGEFESGQKRLFKVQDSLSGLYPSSLAVRIIKKPVNAFFVCLAVKRGEDQLPETSFF
jgi:hypothetical protein